MLSSKTLTIVVFVLAAFSWPSLSGDNPIDCIAAEAKPFKTKSAQSEKPLVPNMGLEVYCSITKCESGTDKPVLINGEAKPFKARPASWSDYQIRQWRVESENTDRCFF
jgi:hypothetical protein